MDCQLFTLVVHGGRINGIPDMDIPSIGAESSILVSIPNLIRAPARELDQKTSLEGKTPGPEIPCIYCSELDDSLGNLLSESLTEAEICAYK